MKPYKLSELVDYESVTVKKSISPESSRKIIHSEMRGTTIVNRVIDKNFERLRISGRYGGGIE